MIAWAPEKHFPHYWLEIMKIIDAVRTLNELRKGSKDNPNITHLAELAENHLQKTIITVPTDSEFDAMKLLAKAKAGWKL